MASDGPKAGPKARPPQKFSKFKRHIVKDLERQWGPAVDDVNHTADLWACGVDELLLLG